jgi:ribosomal 50S subunit-associated protein YjgA (DUF615 family)
MATDFGDLEDAIEDIRKLATNDDDSRDIFGMTRNLSDEDLDSLQEELAKAEQDYRNEQDLNQIESLLQHLIALERAIDKLKAAHQNDMNFQISKMQALELELKKVGKIQNSI